MDTGLSETRTSVKTQNLSLGLWRKYITATKRPGESKTHSGYGRRRGRKFLDEKNQRN